MRGLLAGRGELVKVQSVEVDHGSCLAARKETTEVKALLMADGGGIGEEASRCRQFEGRTVALSSAAANREAWWRIGRGGE